MVEHPPFKYEALSLILGHSHTPIPKEIGFKMGREVCGLCGHSAGTNPAGSLQCAQFLGPAWWVPCPREKVDSKEDHAICVGLGFCSFCATETWKDQMETSCVFSTRVQIPDP